MKKFWILLVVLVMALAACAAPPTGGTDAVATPAPDTGTTDPVTTDTTETDTAGLPDLGGREITVAVENAYRPFNYIDEVTKEPAGWDYDVIGEICVRLNCVPVYQEAAWEGMIQAVADGQYDMAADGITITEERAQTVAFSMGYISVDQRILVALDNDTITSVEDLRNNPELRVGTQTGTTNYETAVELVGDARVDAFEQFPFAVQALINGDVQAVIMDETAGQGYVGENADAIKLVGEPLVSDELGFVFPQGSDLVAAFDAALTSMMNDGSLDKFNAQYFPPQ